MNELLGAGGQAGAPRRRKDNWRGAGGTTSEYPSNPLRDPGCSLSSLLLKRAAVSAASGTVGPAAAVRVATPVGRRPSSGRDRRPWGPPGHRPIIGNVAGVPSIVALVGGKGAAVQLVKLRDRDRFGNARPERAALFLCSRPPLAARHHEAARERRRTTTVATV
jgi:hypothetical protein